MLAAAFGMLLGISLPNPSSIFAEVENRGRAQDALYLRTILPSGAIVVVENMPKAKVLSVQLIVSSRGVAENPQTHGWRHLLEHLLEKGPDKGLGARLEAQGMLLVSETHRDALQFAIVAPLGKLEPALAAVEALMQPLHTTDDELKRETAVLNEEIALNPASKRLGPAVWMSLFGEAGLDPVGAPEVIAKASAAGLEQLRRRHFAPQNLVVSICGPDLDLDAVTKQLRERLPKVKDPVEPSAPARLEPQVAEARATSGEGEAVGVVAPSWLEPESPAVLAAGLALASEREGSFLLYTPSVLPGVVVLGSSNGEAGLAAWLAARKPTDLAALFARGKALAGEWVRQRMATPGGRAGLRGLLYAQSPNASVEDYQNAIRQLTAASFQAAAARFVKAAGP